MQFYLAIFAKIEDMNFWIGVVLNLLLCSFAFRSRHKSLEQYKYLLLLFAVNDIVYSIVQYILVERVITVGYTFTIFLVGEFKHSRHATSYYCSVCTMSFVLLDYQFLYRYWAIKSPDRLNLFATARFQVFLAILAAIEFTAWYSTCYILMLPSEEAIAELIPIANEKFDVGDEEMGWIVSDYWRNGTYNWTAIMGSVSTMNILSICFGFMFFAAFSINHHIAHTKLVSDKAKAMQKQLIYTLCAQTAVPFIFFYIPCGFSINLPLTGLSIPYLSDCVPLLISFFPVLDAMVVILLIRDFRLMFIAMVCAKTPITDVGTTTVSHATTMVSVRTRQSLA